MLDRFQRKITRLRISVTDLCNLYCVYCRPPQGVHHMPRKEILSFEEITLVARCAAQLGVRSFRLTGGEPLTRRNLKSLVASLSSIPGVEDLAMTTNGVLLRRYARALKEAGLMRINISLDSLQKERFRQITGGGNIEDVLEGIEAAVDAGFEQVKVNMVVMRGINEDEVEDFARLSMDKPLEVRFIEYMAFGCRMIEEKKFVPGQEVLERIRKVGDLVLADAENPCRGGAARSGRTAPPLRGPAKCYRLKGARGVLGLILPVSQPFCGDCNRLRLTSQGKLRACLLSGGEVDLKTILRSEYLVSHGKPSASLEKALVEAFIKASNMKPAIHSGRGEPVMCQIGG
ncbi:MAG: cyclic pyranopterin phosphate synthase MoaA [Planctomycetes bacterium RIFCSPHIGHO2_02_FULL_50_42]|nr:MAG: cyclic pyranopterin phosphate synthase MoaA [Planctomycetes bacterium GWA2_50_13]OHB90135.1 MAG: cyclic pyranopterin phosphate synthase MoaA [Planctomycetes bacterium RIFCSPHIGHO2_02_FULL_50_42]OHB96014.1 MAG: cyclic pyranopterin phosphate synthase MoaA [Planctomycetes bacterium RIFCSPLOWO2_02_FULL_50_16]OHC03220.1 MAG: cyclic pyranopterin phosphate synthase MoaA [Planctomycetes bacterium RIFCSPLOWO2_12_FULL_50_35]HCN20146.1 GTP 3',8-cyclase MoaA [Planctomycetia bacterium]